MIGEPKYNDAKDEKEEQLEKLKASEEWKAAAADPVRLQVLSH